MNKGDAAAALIVVRAVTGWSVTPAHWATVDRSVARLTAALAADDGTAVRDAVTTLELLGPVDEALGVPVRAPDEVREHLESAIRILDALGLPAAGEGLP